MQVLATGYLALRFVAQASYENAAKMRVSSAPDVFTGVFTLFRGLRPDDVGLWAPAPARATAEDGPTFWGLWAKVVDIHAMRASDRTLFRVLECGGGGSCASRRIRIALLLDFFFPLVSVLIMARTCTSTLEVVTCE